MTPAQFDDTAKALAGMYQAVTLVKQVARSGEPEARPFETSIGSIFYIDAPSVDTIYGGLGGLRLGLEVMCRQLGDARARDLETTTYVARVMHLERQLVRLPDSFAAIRDAIADLREQADSVGATHPSVVGALAAIYVSNVSSIAPRIMIGGDPTCLNREGNPERIRALLLAALRSTVLWRQLGGRRLRLILARRQLLRTAHRLQALAEAESGA